ncbi:MAG TPA: hypothetical protein VLG69_04435, partial [Candidatus Andersenbacteria bacterium]|nr:hypothetical protein [Candidatus Andersenbacteria bacterium]
MNSRAFWIIVVIGIAAGALFLPVTQYRVVSYGIDSYDTHTPIFSKHIAAEEFTTTSKTIGIGAILVNLFHAKQLSNVDIKIINNETHLLIATQTIPSTSIHDDSFAYANIPNNPIPASTSLRIEFSAPDSTIKNPIGVRYG